MSSGDYGEAEYFGVVAHHQYAQYFTLAQLECSMALAEHIIQRLGTKTMEPQKKSAPTAMKEEASQKISELMSVKPLLSRSSDMEYVIFD